MLCYDPTTMAQLAEIARNRASIRHFNQIVETVAGSCPDPAVGDNLRDLGSSVRRFVTIPTTGARARAGAAFESITGSLGQQAHDADMSNPAKALGMRLATQVIGQAGEMLHEQLDYTFFPDPEERDRFAVTSPGDLVHFLSGSPHMTVSVLHELRRTRRRPDIGRIAQMMPELLDDLFSQEAVDSVAAMQAGFYQSEEACREFWMDAAGLVVRAQSENTSSLNRRLSEDERNGIESKVDAGMQQVRAVVPELSMPAVEVIFLREPGK